MINDRICNYFGIHLHETLRPKGLAMFSDKIYLDNDKTNLSQLIILIKIFPMKQKYIEEKLPSC